MTDPMTTPPLDLPAERITALRDIANAATEGPWRVIEGDGWDGPGVAMDESGMQIGIAYICEKFGQGESEGEDDAAFVAAFDPPTVLALLDRVEELGRDLAAVTVSRDGWQTRAESAEKKVAAVEALVVTAEDAPIEYRNSIQTSHLRAALDGGA